MWDALRPVIKRLDPVRVENFLSPPGTPDVNYTDGWIELKYMPRWPPRGGPLRVDHFTREQRAWLTRRSYAGGRVFLILRVGEPEWLLFEGAVAAMRLGLATRDELYQLCVARWVRLPRKQEIIQWLQA